jgi:hypothetical protein
MGRNNRNWNRNHQDQRSQGQHSQNKNFQNLNHSLITKKVPIEYRSRILKDIETVELKYEKIAGRT